MKKAINYQMANLGIPRESELSGNSDVVYVHAYTRDDGTEVKAHYLPSLMGLVVIITKWMVWQLEEHQMLTISI